VGSHLYGGRWTPKGSFPTVYLCETAEAALAEFLARGRRLKIPDHKALPMVMADVKVKVRNLLNTTEGEVRDVIESFLATEKIHWRSIQDRREAISQAIGRAAHEICFSGLIVDSQALPGSRNIVIFPQKLSATETLSAPSLQPLVTK
jgi:RES domain-containing protein